MASDSAISTNIDGTPYRVSEDGIKIFNIGNKNIFCSGSMILANSIMNQFENSNNKTVQNLKKIAQKEYKNNINKIKNINLEIFAVEEENDIIVSYQISPYNDFEIVQNVINEGIGIFTAGIKTKELSSIVEYEILNSSKINVKKIIRSAFDKISCEQVGGKLSIYKITNVIKLIDTNQINESNIKRLNVYNNEPEMIIAELILGKVLISQRVEIGDDDGFFLIKGASATIKDRCMREVLKMGLLEESPDRFGIRINRYASTDCSNNTILNRVSVTGDDGFIIERNRNNSFVKTFYTSTDGDLFMKGNLQVGDGERVFIANAQGISVGSSSYGSAPFRVDMFGNAYMNKLTAETAVIKDSSFADGLITGGDIIGTSITLGTAPSVIKLFPDIGMWAGAEEFADAPFSVTMDGMVKATNLLVTDGMGGVLINSATNQMQMNNFDIVGAGAIDTDLLSAQIVTADDGFIADLTANRISTLSSANVNQFSNYVKIENNIVKWVTGKASGTGTQKTLSDGRPLYWIDASKTGRMTVEETAYPVLVYTMEEKEKMKWSFEGEGDTAIPYVSMGVGDGTEKGGKFIIRKPNGSVDMRYYASNTEKERAVALLDTGLNIFSDGGEINIRNGDLANINIKADGSILITGKKVDFNLTG